MGHCKVNIKINKKKSYSTVSQQSDSTKTIIFKLVARNYKVYKKKKKCI